MSLDPTHPLEPLVRQLQQEFTGLLNWKKDDWVKSVLAEFRADQSATVMQRLQTYMPQKWNEATLSEAHPSIQTIASAMGGVNPGQWLLASGAEQRLFLFGAWWPWQNGLKISIRLAPFSVDYTREEMEKFIRVFQSWFEV